MNKIKYMLMTAYVGITALSSVIQTKGVIAGYRMTKGMLSELIPGQEGNILKGILLVILTFVILGALLPVLWPLIQASNTAVGNITGTDAPTTFLKTMYPIAILVVGLAIVAALIFYALRQFGLFGGGKRGGRGL